jgi:uncharacterized protein (DUF983 family)
MNRRSCPKCGHEVPKAQRYLRNSIWTNWECSNCGTLLTFDRKPRDILTVVAIILIVIDRLARLRWGLNLNWWTVGLVVLMVIVVVPLVDKIVVVKGTD